MESIAAGGACSLSQHDPCCATASPNTAAPSCARPIVQAGKQQQQRFFPWRGAIRSGRRPCGNGGAGLTYKDAGVDIDAGAELVRRIAAMAPGIGGFGGLYPFGDSYLVAGTDGVGTKLKLAFEMSKHDTIGIDLVAMSVNDIVTSGAKPMFFLDYFATSHLDVDIAEQVIKGIVEGCRQSDCALLGGETAEMPDFYAPGEYDLSGFAVGSVKKDAVIDGSRIAAGDAVVGLPSTGVHSNGFSLVRKILAKSGRSLSDELPGAGHSPLTIGHALLAPTKIYVEQVLDIIAKGGVKGIAHITGGGFTDNIPRVFPEGLAAEVRVGSWTVPPIFKWLKEAGNVEEAEMFRTFNMGIGMVLIMEQMAAEQILKGDEPAFLLGQVINGEGVVYK
ncbi:hypothetical protein SELMODRAFT_92321 [Selaginella moellendorffii]|uniref:phosphoribosylformylglycinamidine cyclo-ligase n=1 Tax=Selaginella moellendorffii TaxID=88036 RepID=D8RFS4_SELML|nr:phosphoribosylformylglycinamidine cyclo-ligase, chloroplastic [Selaginella moellendorffii]EFJ28916.1 hypothetical protein SELMODRAFT_92321 [Selaginella moellendorffii]|eukprot:XP_002969792.1 phosphoribosylformylglycinamidine cyclo-ligase, chloroplastic [Selaginella moellendorffii]